MRIKFLFMVKVLLADDSVSIRQVVALILPVDSFRVKAVGNGKEALAALPSFKPDIVFADIEMPALNGYQLCEKIKGNPATRSIPVVLLAGAFEPFNEGLAKKVRADGSLMKPFEAEDLMGKIDRLLGTGVAAKAGAPEEDLWEAEELKEEAFQAEELPGEALEAETFEAGATGRERGVEETTVREEAFKGYPIEGTIGEVSEEEAYPAMAEVPDTGALADAFREAADRRIAEFLKKVDIRGIIAEAVSSKIKASMESVLWEVAPEMTEKLLREALKETTASLKKELQNVMWETVPELAESIIKKEIDRIRAESA